MNSFFVNFEQTWGKGIFLGVDPKMTRSDKSDPKSPQVQARDSEGNLKWVATIAVPVQAFEKIKKENMEITINAPTKPYEALPIGTSVIVEGLQLGIMKAEKPGFPPMFWSAENIRPAAPERVASTQPQPARVPSGERVAASQ